MAPMPSYVYAMLLTGWAVWLAPFLLRMRNFRAPATIDRRARWGLLIEVVAFSLLWQTRFWERSPHVWQTVLSALCFAVAGCFSWAAVRTLGRHLRFDAGLDADHQLVRTGPYRIVRHPIYTSLLFLMFGLGFVIAPFWLFCVALAIFFVGTTIRIRVEDALLAERFGEQFEAYRREVPALIPFLK